MYAVQTCRGLKVGARFARAPTNVASRYLSRDEAVSPVRRKYYSCLRGVRAPRAHQISLRFVYNTPPRRGEGRNPVVPKFNLPNLMIPCTVGRSEDDGE